MRDIVYKNDDLQKKWSLLTIGMENLAISILRRMISKKRRKDRHLALGRVMRRANLGLFA